MESSKNFDKWFQRGDSILMDENTCNAGLKASEVILEDSFDDSMDWQDATGAHYTLVRRTDAEGKLALMGSKMYLESGAMHMTLDRYILLPESGEFARIPDRINPNETYRDTSQSDWGKFVDIIDSGMMHMEVIRGLEDKLGHKYKQNDEEEPDWDKLLDE